MSRHIVLKLTEAEADALQSALSYVRMSGCEWNDTDEGVGNKKDNDAIARVDKKLEHAIDWKRTHES